MFGACKVCAEKEKRIAVLEAQIAFLRDLARPAIPQLSRRSESQMLEADAIMDGKTEQMFIEHSILNPMSALTAEEAAAAEERDMILSGNY